MSIKLKCLEFQNSSFTNEMKEAQTKVSQLELKCSKLTGQLDDVCGNVGNDEKELREL